MSIFPPTLGGTPTPTHTPTPLPINPSLYSTPAKKINQQIDMANFQLSIAQSRIQLLISNISQAVRSKVPTSSFNNVHPVFIQVISILNTLSKWADDIQPSKGPRRFGNSSFRLWHSKLEHDSYQLLSGKLLPYIEEIVGNLETPVRNEEDDIVSSNNPLVELIPYFQQSFGSKQRLDFGTGHELSFLAFIGGLILTGIVENPSGEDLLLVFETYFKVIRKLVIRYTLEPAGSHGVWGLDDHFHLPYILGSAQLVSESGGIASTTVPPPRAILDKSTADKLSHTNLYFSAISFIYEVKRGPFYEHSPILYDITGVASWNKIHKGMIKMYNAEVLGKFPVVQHFRFGNGLYPWKDNQGNELTSSQPREEEGINTSAIAAATTITSSINAPTISHAPIPSTIMPIRNRSHNLMPTYPNVSSNSNTTSEGTVAPWTKK